VPPFGAAPLPLAQGISGVRERRFCAVKTTVAGPALPHRPARVMAEQPGVWPPGRCTTWPALSKTSGPWVAWFALPGAQADFRAAGIARRPEGLNAG